MNITHETNSYNHRRYGKPWIATVDFSETAKGQFSFGDWTGDHYNGGVGVLTIEAEANDIIAIGQKDNRQPRNSAPDFFTVTADGELEEIGDKGDAYKHFLAQEEATPDMNALAAEKKRLLDRIAEIDAIIV